ncbi:hypothetical protein [Kribbella sindirgiensis]|uniref:Oxidoreductase n=1 Tax=Kribbella sindirgiensis TaxID=1124744 RepID=A0A4R0I095_9ACTN|nr:hypothetical protein [Kribbella sindirgiensis]TCC17255.1 hypothetical protein E0H50_39670 [Kribbella sindirgiensis]
MSNSLALVAEVRAGDAGSPGDLRTDRHFLEFVVDGERLGRVLGPFLDYDDATEDYVSVLVRDWPTGRAFEDLDRLLGAVPEPSLGGRTAIYVCAECGDVGCGAVTAVVEVHDELVVWRDFGYQNDYEPFDQRTVFTEVGPFTFDRRSYARVLEEFRTTGNGEPT